MASNRLVIIPTYNERENIGKLIDQISSLERDFDIIIIDDNSPDGTGGVVDAITRGNKRVHLIQRSSKLGLGTAYREGFAWAMAEGYRHVFTMDADLSHPAQNLVQLDALLEQHSLVIGSRYIQGGGIDGWPLVRKLLSGMGNRYVRSVTGLPVMDCTSGFVGLRKECIEFLLGEKIKSEGYSFLIELKYLLWKNGFSMIEYPIIFTDRVCGRSKISRKIIVEALFLALKLRFRKSGSGQRGNTAFKLIDRYVGVPLVWLLGIITPENPRRGKESISSILVIKLSAMGDTVLLVPALRALRLKYPDNRITALCTNINSEIFRRCPYVDEVIVLNIGKFLLQPLKIVRTLRKEKFGIALDFDQWLRFSPLLAYLSGASHRIGFKTEGQARHYAYTQHVEHRMGRHEVNCFLDILKPLDIEGVDESLEYQIDESSKQRAIIRLKKEGIEEYAPFIIFHPETPAHGGQRQWPSDKYIELGKKIVGERKEKILITGTRKDFPGNLKIAAAIGNGAIALSPMGLMEYAAIVCKAQTLVCGNTGIMHLACAVGTPVVALHGPTDPAKWGPKGKKCKIIKSIIECSPCLYLGFEYGCSTNRCMDAISIAEVFEAINEIVA